jgi:NtrC-family two-component system response regulator AlgB
LRERPGDLLRFARHYLKHFAKQCGRPSERFSPEAEAAIRFYSWPGNLRELRNSIERAVIMGTGNEVTPADLPGEIGSDAAPGPSSTTGQGAEPETGSMISLEKLEEIHIRRVLERTSSLGQAAEVLGIDQATLYRRRKKMGLD